MNYIWAMMKIRIVFLLIVCVSATSRAQNLRFALNPVQYSTADGAFYWDIYSTLDASTVAYEFAADSLWHANFKVALQLDDKLDVFVFEYVTKDSASNAPLLLEKSSFASGGHSKQFLKVMLVDVVGDQSWEISDTLVLNNSELVLSKPVFLDERAEAPKNYTKGDVAVVPKVNLGKPIFEDVSTISWYTEGYVRGGKYLLRYRIEDVNGEIVPGSAGFKRCATGANPLLVRLDFTEQQSGNYSLVVQGLDSTGQEVASYTSSFVFYNQAADSLQLFNPAGTISKSSFEANWGKWSEVHEYLRMIAPVTSLSQRRILSNLKATTDTALAAQFLVGYWAGAAPTNPEATWKAYLSVVRKVDREFGSKTLPGYKTQMGRVFLQYGAPSLVEERPFDGKNYPYQIWQYDQLKSESTPVQQNQVFIFVDQELVGRQYTLIHSSALGEVKDHKWQYHLSRHTNAGPDIDATSTQMGRDNFGERVSNSLIIGNQGTWFDRFNN